MNLAHEINSFIATHGVRRFEPGASGDYDGMQIWLLRRGWNVTWYRSCYRLYKGCDPRKGRIIKGIRELVETVDAMRIAEGLEPLRRRNVQ